LIPKFYLEKGNRPVSDLSQLRQLLSVHFNESELQNLTFDLGLDYEMLAGPTKGDKARELLMHLWRSGRLPELVELCREMRPKVAWPDLLPEPARPAALAPEPGPIDRRGQAVANPFTYGNPISDPARFFGRSREIEQVFNRLRNAEAESSSIVGGRRIGKSSLLNYLAHADVRRRHGLDPERSIFVYVDLQMVDSHTTPGRLWQRLLAQMERHCRDGDLALKLREIVAAGLFDNFTLADLFDAVDRQGRHVVFLLDEFENVTTNPNFDTGFFYGLRSLAIQHSLSLVTSSQHELIELTHSQAIRSSPFFNIFANINVRLFSDVEAQQLLAASLAGTGIVFSEEELATMAEVAGGHPFFLQAAGHFLFAAYAKYADAAKRRAAWLQAFREEVAPHLAHFWRTAGVHEQITLLLLALLSRQAGSGRSYFDLAQLERLYPRAGQSLARLTRLGYVAEGAGRYALFSSAFGAWVLDEIRSGNHVQRDAADEAGQAALSGMPAARRKALAPLLAQANSGYRRLLAGWVAQAHDIGQVVRLWQEGLV
jgi:hypothetical protein